MRLFNKITVFFEKRPVLSWALTILYAGMIFYFSAQPKPLENIPLFYELSSAVKHILEYIGFGFLLFVSFLSIGKEKKEALLLAFLVAAAYGASDEIHQYFVPGRVCDFFDWGVDALGSFVGSFLALSQKK